MAKRTNYGFNKRQKEKQKQEKAERKREQRLARKEGEGEDAVVPEDPDIVPIDPADLGLPE